MSSANPPPPPPPPRTTQNPYSVSPVLISIVGAVGIIFLLMSYYRLLLKYCACFQRLFRRGARRDEEATVIDGEVSNSGLETSIIAKNPHPQIQRRRCQIRHRMSSLLNRIRRRGIGQTAAKMQARVSYSVYRHVAQHPPHLPPVPSRHIDWPLSPSQPFSFGTRRSRGRTPNQLFLCSSARHSECRGASGSQWYQRFRWSKRASSPSREEIHRSLLQSGASVANENEIAVDLSGHDNTGNGNSDLHVSNGGREGTS
ncbi:hypothetical protein KI387_006470 [Taxus chinensis]|uniref:Uncharacterized protein n=1 Tax=Taxus chinensis TaxID=29808 RepID=A0AA38GMU0_TAXCH|nr:hypothetical protein KI387_006470 [Taxus chinensis]